MLPSSSSTITEALNFRIENPLTSSMPPAKVQNMAATNSRYFFVSRVLKIEESGSRYE